MTSPCSVTLLFSQALLQLSFFFIYQRHETISVSWLYLCIVEIELDLNLVNLPTYSRFFLNSTQNSWFTIATAIRRTITYLVGKNRKALDLC